MKKKPKVNVKRLAADKKRNFRQRLDFIDQYVAWLKKTPNKKWSKQQNAAINQNLA